MYHLRVDSGNVTRFQDRTVRACYAGNLLGLPEIVVNLFACCFNSFETAVKSTLISLFTVLIDVHS